MKTLSGTVLSVLLVLALMAASYGAGRFFAMPVIEVLPATTASASVVTVRDGSDAAALAKALSEVEALKTEKATLRKELDELQAASDAAPTSEARPRHQTWQERMEEMKKNDPERYKEEMARRERFMQAIVQARAERDDFLSNIDLSLLTPEQRQTHNQFTEALARQAEVEAQMRAAMEAGEPPSEELRNVMRESFQSMNALRDSERSALLGAVATSMGLQGADVEDFSKLVEDVYEATGRGFNIRMDGSRRPRGGGSGGNP